MKTALLTAALLCGIVPVPAGGEGSAPPSRVYPEMLIAARKHAVLRALQLTAGRGFFREDLEIAAATWSDGSVTVVFRRPTTQHMVTVGRRETRELTRFRFPAAGLPKETPARGTEALTDARYTREKDWKRSNAARAALAHLWARRRFDGEELALNAREAGAGFDVWVQQVPYTPDAETLVRITAQGNPETRW